MFWNWFWNLYHLSFGFIQPCPVCRLWPAEDCGYAEKTPDYYSGGFEFDCSAPDAEEIECNGCHHLTCSKCKHEILHRKFKNA